MKPFFLIIFLALMLSLCNCNPPPGAELRYPLWIINNESDNRIFTISFNYPDTLLPHDSKELVSGRLPLGERISYDIGEPWNKRLAKTQGGKVSVFILDLDTFNRYSRETMRVENKILKRYDLNAQDLEDINYTIIYP